MTLTTASALLHLVTRCPPRCLVWSTAWTTAISSQRWPRSRDTSAPACTTRFGTFCINCRPNRPLLRKSHRQTAMVAWWSAGDGRCCCENRPSTTEAMPGPLPRRKPSRANRLGMLPCVPCAKRLDTTRKSASAFRAPSKARLPAPATTSWMPNILQPSRTGRPPRCAG